MLKSFSNLRYLFGIATLSILSSQVYSATTFSTTGHLALDSCNYNVTGTAIIDISIQKLTATVNYDHSTTLASGPSSCGKGFNQKVDKSIPIKIQNNTFSGELLENYPTGPSTGSITYALSGKISTTNGTSKFTGSFSRTDQFSGTPNLSAIESGPFELDVKAQEQVQVLNITATTESGPAPLKVTLDASSSVTTANSVFTWKSSDGQTATGVTATFNYSKPGTYDVTLSVTDEKGVSTSQSKKIVVSPAPSISFTATPESGTVPLKVTLDSAASVTPANSTFTWKSSDGQSATGGTASFNYTQSGVYEVTLQITDSKGVALTQTKKIIVAPKPSLASASFNTINNTPEQALPVLVNDVSVQQSFTSPNDVDWYEFYAKAGAKITIEIPGESIGVNINPSLSLVDNKNNPLSSDIKQSTKGSSVRIAVTTPYTGIFRIKITNNPPSAKINAPGANEYQLRVFLTDAPQQAIVKGSVINGCNSQGIGNAEVSALLNTTVSDSTLTYKTGEYGLTLNTGSYTLKSVFDKFNSAEHAINILETTTNNIVTFNQTPTTGCQNNIEAEIDPIVQQQQAVAVFDASTGLLIIRDIWFGDYVYYVELQMISELKFRLINSVQLPGTIHVVPGVYGSIPLIAELPTVFAFGKTWKVQLKNQGDWMFTVEKAE